MEAQLSPRLLTVARLIRPGAVAADIGTDHGALPVWLMKNGLAKRVYATDLRGGPLNMARENIRRHELSDRIFALRRDGLCGVPHAATDIVLAGMGGELISQILAAAPWIREGDRRIVAQPMTRAESLRAYLWDNGWEITEERLCRDDGRIYSVLASRHTGKNTEYTPAQLLLGRDTPRDELYYEQAQRLLVRQERLLLGLQKSGRADREPLTRRASALRDELLYIVNAQNGEKTL